MNKRAVKHAVAFSLGPSGLTGWISGALLHKPDDMQASPYPGRIYPTGSVTGMPSAV
ncbi:hypothetical protein [Pseudophaeobacter sp.]|uniref:hypothetical protein n=1 Tax=Pseudophaeobacter sp. TaxID=1971739 RepID=UPI004059E885